MLIADWPYNAVQSTVTIMAKVTKSEARNIKQYLGTW